MYDKVQVNNSYLHCNPQYGTHTSEYHTYCRNLIVDALEDVQDSINVVLGNGYPYVDNEFPICFLDIQLEHTLVKKGGRSVTEVVHGGIPTDDNDTYLVRVDKFDYYKNLDGVIEYSIPNILNLQSAHRKDIKDYSKKCKYIAPLVYDEDVLDSHDRSGAFTLFSIGSSPRRDAFHKNTQIDTYSNIFCKDKLADVYYNKAVMVNLHQTDHHHTFEELRVLPALSQGLVVIAEESPLKQFIPYSDSIIWAALDDIPAIVSDVENNYSHYRNKLITESLRETLQTLRENNKENIKALICQNTR